MAYIEGGVPISGFLSPTDTVDTYAITKEEYHQGGYRSVANITEMNSIPAARRKPGMLVYVVENGKTYRLGTDDAYTEVSIESGNIPRVDLSKLFQKYEVGKDYAEGDAVWYVDDVNGYYIYVCTRAHTAADAAPSDAALDDAGTTNWEKSWGTDMKGELDTALTEALAAKTEITTMKPNVQIAWKWKGFVADLAALNAITDATTGDVYMVGEELTGTDFYVRLNNTTTPANSRWVKIYNEASPSSHITKFANGVSYKAGDVVFMSMASDTGSLAELYICKKDHVSNTDQPVVGDNWDRALSSMFTNALSKTVMGNAGDTAMVLPEPAFAVIKGAVATVDDLQNIDAETGHIYMVGTTPDRMMGWMYSKNAADATLSRWYPVGNDNGEMHMISITEPTTAAVGGIPAGVTFNNSSVNYVINMLLHPFIAPEITDVSFTNNRNYTYALNENIATDNPTLKYKLTNLDGVRSVVIKIKRPTDADFVDANITGDTNTADNSVVINNLASFGLTTAGQVDIKIEVTTTDVNTAPVEHVVTLSWVQGIYGGAAADEDISFNACNLIATDYSKTENTVSLNYPAGGYKFVFIPSALNLIELRDAKTGFLIPYVKLADATYTLNGTDYAYKRYRTSNALGGSIAASLKLGFIG